MDSSSGSEFSEESEVDILKEQLQTYQSLNFELSKRVQDIKIMLSVAEKELNLTRNDLISEKMESTELRRTLLTMNGHFTAFFNNYISNLENCKNRTNLDVTVPGLNKENLQPFHASTSSGVFQYRPVNKSHFSVPIDPDRPNVLHTICEEESFSADPSGPKISSTPLPIFFRDITNQIQQPETPNDLISPSDKHGTPKRAPGCSNDSVDVINSSADSIGTPIRPSRFSNKFVNSSIASIPEEAEDVLDNFVLDVTDYNPSDSQMELFKETFPRKSRGTATNENNKTEDQQVKLTAGVEVLNVEKANQEVNVTNENVPSHEDKENDEIMLDSQATQQSLGYNSTLFENDSTLGSTIGGTRKRKAKTFVTRRSSSRPKRKTRLEPPKYEEKKLNVKLRRPSKDSI